ncbi:hypothetical protein BDP27DRAFT_1423385 [Rhodocollybia butyracea]|uniref:Uncharacterized protein n=1 Tax=Rhodocollybia butyracea TaxID=206335 RepID=A0A9P5PQZ1_9AGAR|nr:hypothetical protein BDP27DRAFT_1423385 [Rhodocollybia butyracea]
MAGDTRSPSTQHRSRRRTSRTRSITNDIGDNSGSQATGSGYRRRGQKSKTRGGIGLPGVSEVTDNVLDTVGGVGNTVGDTVGGTVDTVGGAVGGAVDAVGGVVDGLAGVVGDKPLKLQLELNLDVAVELKARVHGDLTISLLEPNGSIVDRIQVPADNR